jgi:multidrug efflux pump subunit AcrA (membrane-fusion protein)
MAKKKYIIPAALVIVIVIVWVVLGRDPGKSTNIFVSPKTGPFLVNITTNGELKAKNSTLISAPSAGMRNIRVYQVKIANLVPEGTRVKKGEVIAVLDRSQLTDALKEATTNLEQQKTDLSQAKLDTASTLSQARNSIINDKFNVQQAKIAVEQSKYESPAVQKNMQFDLDKAKRTYDQQKESYKLDRAKAESKIQNLRIKVQKYANRVAKINEVSDKFTIRAPQNGMVIYKTNPRTGAKIEQGDQVTFFNSTVAELPDFSVMQSVTYVSEVDIQKVKRGQKANISLDAYPDKQLTGEITKVANIGEERPNSSSKVFKVTIQIDQSDSSLRPGMTTQNIIHTNYVDSALYIPLEAVHAYHDSLNVVFKHKGGRPVMQQVLLGLMNDNDAIVKAGLTPHDQLYLSVPSDTSNIKKEFLQNKVIQKYHKQQKEKVEKQHIEKQHKETRGGQMKYKRKHRDSSRVHQKPVKKKGG